MRAGRLRDRCSLFRPERVQNDTGGFDDTWVEVGKLWAEITLPTGRVAPVAQKLASVVSAEIQARPRADLAVGCRLVCRGVTYQVDAALQDYRIGMVRLLCSNVPNPRSKP